MVLLSETMLGNNYHTHSSDLHEIRNNGWSKMRVYEVIYSGLKKIKKRSTYNKAHRTIWKNIGV